MSVGISITPHCHGCHDFLGVPTALEVLRTVWISPIAIRDLPALGTGLGEVTQISWACSLRHACFSNCFFARGKQESSELKTQENSIKIKV